MRTRPIDEEKVKTELLQDGISVIQEWIPSDTLDEMHAAFASKLKRQQWNDMDGYEKTERYRLMVQHVLLLHQGFIDVALNNGVRSVIKDYIGPGYVLAEAKGWESLPTKRDFHGWHGDAWYDQDNASTIPKEVKMALYLTDVKSGFFCYIKGTHQKQHPRPYRLDEIASYSSADIVETPAKRGSVILFDTSGIHRQGTPILEPRKAVFYAYHEPTVPLQPEDVEYNRYHPLLLNAALLGDLDEECRRVLGFGEKSHLNPAFERRARFPTFHRAVQTAYDVLLAEDNLRSRVSGKLRAIASGLTSRT
jgi:hypothetical protein